MQSSVYKENVSNIDKKKGIMAVIGCALTIFFPGSLVFGFPGLMGPIWGEALGIGSGPLSYVMFFLLASLGIFMFFVGKWTNTLGVRKLMIIGTLIAGLASVMIAFVSSIGMIYIWAFLIGTSSCFIYSPGVNSVQQWFPHKRGMVSGLVNLTFGISAAIMVPIYRLLLVTVGYQYLCFIVAGITLVVGFTASPFTELPSKVGVKITNSNTNGESTSLGNTSLTPKEAVKTRNFWLLWAVWALMGAAGITMVTQSVRFGMFLGFDLALASTILVVFNITNGISRVVSGTLSDSLGRNKTLAVTFVAAGIAYIILPYTSSLRLILPLVALIGFGYGTLFSCSAPLISDIFGFKYFGIILGLVFTSYGFLSGMIGPAATGYLLDRTNNNYQVVFTYLGIMCLLSAILIMPVKEPKKFNK